MMDVGEQTLALGQRHGMRGYGADVSQRGTGAADQMMLNRQDGFAQ